MTLKQKTFIAEAGDRAVLSIDPARVDLHSGTKWPVGKQRLRELGRWLPAPVVRLLRPWIKQAEPFARPRAHFGALEPVEATERYRKVADFIRHRHEVTHSLWYTDLMAELDRNGVSRHKAIEMRSRDEVLDFLHGYVGGLVESLATDGFSPDNGGFESTAVIAADGALCKTGSGNHRFNIAKALGVAPYPLRVVAVHEDWLPEGLSPRDLTTEDVLALLPEVEAAHR